jgi:hypothetical protein
MAPWFPSDARSPPSCFPSRRQRRAADRDDARLPDRRVDRRAARTTDRAPRGRYPCVTRRAVPALSGFFGVSIALLSLSRAEHRSEATAAFVTNPASCRLISERSFPASTRKLIEHQTRAHIQGNPAKDPLPMHLAGVHHLGRLHGCARNADAVTGEGATGPWSGVPLLGPHHHCSSLSRDVQTHSTTSAHTCRQAIRINQRQRPCSSLTPVPRCGCRRVETLTRQSAAAFSARRTAQSSGPWSARPLPSA